MSGLFINVYEDFAPIFFIYFKTHEFKQKQKQPPRISRSYKKCHLKQPVPHSLASTVIIL